MKARAAVSVPAMLLVAAISGELGAQPTFKCLSGTAVTYSNTPCDQLGLKSGGQVADRMSTLPAASPAQSKPSTPPSGKSQPAASRANEIDMPPVSTVKPVNPLIEKLAK